MKIVTSKRTPSIKEIKENLDHEFSDNYSTRLFGIGKEKSVIVKKSTFVGAQISTYENEIIVEETLPSIATSLLFTALFFDGLFFLFNLFFESDYGNLNQEIGVFLKNKYN